MCSKNRQDAIYVVNTKYDFEFCLKERTQQEYDIEVKLNRTRTEGIPYQKKYVICSMKCFLLLGSSQHNKYLEDKYDGMPWNVIMKRCREFDITLSQEIGEVTRPKQTNFQIEEGLECFQNDEGNKNASDVGSIPEEQCNIIWNVTLFDINGKRLVYQPPAIKNVQLLPGSQQKSRENYMSILWSDGAFVSQDRVVADQFWLCGNNILRPILAKMWRGRCAKVQVVTEIAILPSIKDVIDNLQTNNLNRQKIAYEVDENIQIDKIGQPRGIPDKFKARSEVAAGFEALLPAIGIAKNAEWINRVYALSCVTYFLFQIIQLGCFRSVCLSR